MRTAVGSVRFKRRRPSIPPAAAGSSSAGQRKNTRRQAVRLIPHQQFKPYARQKTAHLCIPSCRLLAGITKDDIDLMTHFYVLACAGLLESWLLGEIDRTPEELIAFLDRTLKEHICGARICWGKSVKAHTAK